jgi:hypothetical protein
VLEGRGLHLSLLVHLLLKIPRVCFRHRSTMTFGQSILETMCCSFESMTCEKNCQTCCRCCYQKHSHRTHLHLVC